MVAAIEGEFVPLLVINNKRGRDAEILKRFKEPAWNYQVVRFLDAEAKDIIPRKDRVFTAKALATRMVEALEKHGKKAPAELQDIAKE